jgi:hypothetical protein
MTTMSEMSEQDVALLNERIAHGEERLETLDENVRILRLLFAYQQGAITAVEFVERVRGAVPDPLAEQKPDKSPRE